MRHREVAEDFGSGCTKGKGSRMFIEEDTIFSYGRHFPIAQRFNKYGVDYLFNSDEYSSSTSTHKSYVLRELRGNVLHIAGCDLSNASKQLKRNNANIEGFKDMIKRARSRKEEHLDKVAWLEQQNALLKPLAIAEEL